MDNIRIDEILFEAYNEIKNGLEKNVSEHLINNQDKYRVYLKTKQQNKMFDYIKNNYKED